MRVLFPGNHYSDTESQRIHTLFHAHHKVVAPHLRRLLVALGLHPVVSAAATDVASHTPLPTAICRAGTRMPHRKFRALVSTTHFTLDTLVGGGTIVCLQLLL